MCEYNRSALLDGLELSLEEQDRMHGCIRDDVQRSNLKYAFQRIIPTTHTEFAFVVWAGDRCQPVHGVIDEYCRRRAGQESLMFDHELLNLKTWCQPDTQRILVFREQLESLSKELTGESDGRRIAKGIYAFGATSEGISQDDFIVMVKAIYGYSVDFTTVFYNHIRERYASSLPYSWCSTIVERAFTSAGSHIRYQSTILTT